MQIFHIRRWVIRMLYSVVDLGRQAVMECWRHTVSVEMPERSVRPAVLVIPGGGYSYISDRECEPVASAFFAKGFHVFVLRYAVGKDADKGRPFMNAMAAIVMLRRKAEDWGIAASKIAVCGFSAGGHLAAASGILSHTKEWLYEVGCTEGENLPNAVILGYPVIRELLRITGSVRCIDVAPRLHFFAGTWECIRAMCQSDHGLKGLFSADDDRLSYYLDSTQSKLLKAYGLYYDQAMNLFFFSTDIRLERIQSIAKERTNMEYCLLGNERKSNGLHVFTHENRLANEEICQKIIDLCVFAQERSIPFAFPLQRLDLVL